MQLEDLIKEAANKSPEFKKKWGYWVVQRKKIPTFEWLMENLELALGSTYVKMAAKDAIEAMNSAPANNDIDNTLNIEDNINEVE